MDIDEVESDVDECQRVAATLELLERVARKKFTSEDVLQLASELGVTRFWLQLEKTKMPKLNEMIGSKYLKKEDAIPPVLVTLADLRQETINKDGKAETVWVGYFEELDKGMVLKSTNLQLLAQVCGSEQSEDWIGRKVVLYADPTVSMAGKVVGGLRIRAPKRPAKPAIEEIKDMEDDVPF